MPQLPLEGVRVIDHGVVYAGTAATTLLADMGAEVIRVESIGRFPAMTRGFRARPPEGLEEYPGYADGQPGERPWDRWFQYHAIQRNKIGVTLEINRPEGVAVYEKLVRRADIILENFSQGTMERLGLGYDVLKSWKQDIILISASGLGSEGPYKGYGTFGTNLDAVSGMMALRGYPGDDLTMRDPIPVWSDNVSASAAAFAVLTALHYRERTGKGQFIDMAQCEGFLPHLGEVILDYTMNGRVREAVGNRDSAAAPHGCYPCKGEDKWVTIAVSTDAQWRAFCGVLGSPSWASDPRFADTLQRWQHQDELDRLVGAWTREHTPREVLALLHDAGVPAGPVFGPADVYEDPHLQARGFFHTITHTEAGTHRYPGMFFTYSGTPAGIRIPANCLGEHNQYVYGELLGMTQDEIAELERQNVIGTEYLPDV
jgi:crotonobetainyl-CoA:carnitine CoA-transferase CaiB-like acyl-CoA transferase